MKKIVFGVFIFACAVAVFACSDNKVSKAPILPAPKPATYIDTIVVAAKKSDFYLRMAFDLADMFLSVETAANSVSRVRYGDDAKFAASYDFSSAAAGTGIIKSSAFGGLEFEYYNSSGSVINDFSGISGNISNETKRKLILPKVDTENLTQMGTGGAKKCAMTFYNTDTSGALSVDINFVTVGNLNANGSSIGGPSVLLQSPYLTVENSSGTLVPFNVTVNVSGRTQLVPDKHTVGANDVFIIQSGNMTITGTDGSGVTYTVNLQYSQDKASGKITASNGLSADIFVDKYDTYYTDPSTGKKVYLLWDLPL